MQTPRAPAAAPSLPAAASPSSSSSSVFIDPRAEHAAVQTLIRRIERSLADVQSALVHEQRRDDAQRQHRRSQQHLQQQPIILPQSLSQSHTQSRAPSRIELSAQAHSSKALPLASSQLGEAAETSASEEEEGVVANEVRTRRLRAIEKIWNSALQEEVLSPTGISFIIFQSIMLTSGSKQSISHRCSHRTTHMPSPLSLSRISSMPNRSFVHLPTRPPTPSHSHTAVAIARPRCWRRARTSARTHRCRTAPRFDCLRKTRPIADDRLDSFYCDKSFVSRPHTKSGSRVSATCSLFFSFFQGKYQP
jgi:hypothetical protein